MIWLIWLQCMLTITQHCLFSNIMTVLGALFHLFFKIELYLTER